ncbi:MAG TPA: AAA family ATPase [Candidatus Limnocylindrales bacterium]|nr:AAA family ATPase [Candidatus Limnocylindrales bacterium]
MGLVIEIPDPCLVVLVGAAGAGKSTLAGRHFGPEEILSSDAYRGILTGDEADQRLNRVAFSILHRELERRLAAGRMTVVDATSVTSGARRQFLRRASRHRVPAVAIVLDLDPAIVLARNASRADRVVPTFAVRRQLGDVARSLGRGELDAEGFSAIHHVRTPEDLDRLEIRRVRA